MIVPRVGQSFVKPSVNFMKLVPIISVVIAINKYIYGIYIPPCSQYIGGIFYFLVLIFFV